MKKEGKIVDARLQTAEELSNGQFEALMESERSAKELLFADDTSVRVAAAMVCETVWSSGPDPKILQSCLAIIKQDCDTTYRIVSARILGRVLDSTKDQDVTEFFCNLILSPVTPAELKLESYWALRDVQIGYENESTDIFVKRMVCTQKTLLRIAPYEVNEEELRQKVTPQPGFKREFWDNAEEIDTDFVRELMQKTPDEKRGGR